MKKIVTMIVAIAMLSLLLYGCGAAPENDPPANATNAPAQIIEEVPNNEVGQEQSVITGDLDKDTVLSKIESACYYHHDTYWDYAYIAIQNNSPVDIEATAYIKYYDENGTVVHESEASSIFAIASGTEGLITLNPSVQFATMDYTLTVEESFDAMWTTEGLSYTVTAEQGKEIVTITNSGTESVDTIIVDALFFNGSTLVSHDHEYVTEELAPGATITVEFEGYEDYTSVKIYMNAS